MNLSKETIEVLKNFSRLNDNILIEKGNVLRTRTVDRTVFASATVSETFEKEVAIGNVNQFLATIGVFDTAPELTFGDAAVEMKAGRSGTKYYYANKDAISYCEKPFPVLNYSETFKLTEQNIKQLLKAIGVVYGTHLVFEKDGDTITVSAADVDKHQEDIKKKSNPFQIQIDGSDSKAKFKYFVDVNLFTLLPGDYEVSIFAAGDKKLAHFKGAKSEYFIAVESFSTFEG